MLLTARKFVLTKKTIPLLAFGLVVRSSRFPAREGVGRRAISRRLMLEIATRMCRPLFRDVVKAGADAVEGDMGADRATWELGGLVPIVLKMALLTRERACRTLPYEATVDLERS